LKISNSRVLEIDATRGAAMMGVVLSHSAQYLNAPKGALAHALVTVGLIATPTFLLLSGVICSYLSSREHKTVSEGRWRLIDRSLFLLLVAHLVFGLTHATWESASAALGRSFYITDAVGIGLLTASVLLGRASRLQLFVTGLAMLFGGWLILHSVTPHGSFERYVMRLFVGYEAGDDGDEGWIVPIIPYLGLFLIGMAGGLEYARRRASGTPQQWFGRFCFSIGAVACVTAVTLKAAWLVSRHAIPEAWRPVLYQITEPVMKIPPGFCYILAFGGAGMVMASVIVHLAGTDRGRRIVEGFATIGRASLFVFLMQYWFISVPARALHFQGGPLFWFPALIVTLCALWLLARAWDRAGANRWLTLGLRRFADRLPQQDQPAELASGG
jgi:hypothetical protein